MSVIAVSLACAAALTASPAFAVKSKQIITAKISPTKAGTAKKPANVSLNVFPRLDPFLANETPPFATTRAVIDLDKHLKLNGAKLPTCTAGQVQLGSCSAKAKVGKGTAAGQALGLVEHLSVVAYNGPGGKSLLMLVQDVGSDAPVHIDEVLVGKLTKGSSPFGTRMTVPIPQNLQQVAPGVFAPLTAFNLTLKAGTSSKPYVALSGCPKGGLSIGGAFSFTDSTSQKVSAKAACKK